MTFNFFKLFIIFFIALPIFILSTETTFAQDSTSKYLDEVIVREKRKTAKERGEFKRHGQTVEVLMEEELNRNNPAFIEQSLGTMAGVQVDKRTQIGGQRLVIRGYGNDQKFNNWGVKVYYNGIPITTAEGITILDDIDFSLVNNIEIVKGPAATMYGSGVGGVARFYMKSSEDKGISLTQKTVMGSFDLFQSNTRLDIVNDNSAVTLSFGHLQSDGYRSHGSSLKNFTTFFGEFKLNKKQSLTTYLSHNFSLENIAGQIPYVDYYSGIDNGNTAYIKKNARNEFLTSRFSITHDFKFSNSFSNRSVVFYYMQDLKNISAGADGNSQSPSLGFRSTSSWKKRLFDNVNNDFSFGTEIQQSRSLASSYRFLGTDDSNPLKVQDISKGSYFKNFTNQYSYFIHNSLNFKNLDLSLILGISLNKVSYSRLDLLANSGLISGYNKDLSFEKDFKTSYNPHIALQKSFKAQIINLSYSEGYNAPTASTSFIGTINKVNDDLIPEKARMFDLGIQGLLLKNCLDYQISLFNIDITNKLTQLSGINPSGGSFSYFANTGNQNNLGFELSLGYLFIPKTKSFLKKVEPFLNFSKYQFKYNDFRTKFANDVVDYSNKQVVGVPQTKYSLGLDIVTKAGIYLNNTLNFIGDVYTDFANTNNVKGFTLFNSKIGFKHVRNKYDIDIYFAGNNLTNQINYTFLFLGNNINDSDPGNNYSPGVATDVTPGPRKFYLFGGVNVKFKFY